MISNSVIQNTIDGIKVICHVDIYVMDIDAKIIAATCENGEIYESAVLTFIDSPADCQEVGGVQFVKVIDEDETEYVVIVKGDNENLYTVAKMAAFQIRNLIVAYKEKYDKDNFIKNLLLDNMLTVDMYNRAKKLHIEAQVRRVVFIIRTDSHAKTDPEDYLDNNELWIVRNLFATQHSKDFVTAVDERNIILVKELKEEDDGETLDRIANTILDMLNTEAMTNVNVSYGTIAEEIREISRSYREARLALEISSIFSEGKGVSSYDNLGLGRLIFQLPDNLCEMFVNEILRGHTIDDFDDELITTITKFFSNNLNISETSRQLFIHRNTLVYRLDKIQKMTGLDLRVFEDVVVFKVALMVSKYLKYVRSKEVN